MTKRGRRALSLGLLAVVLPACARSHAFLAEVRADYAAGRYEQAHDRLEELEEKRPRERHVYAANRGVVELALLEPEEAVRALRTARDGMDAVSAPGYASWFRTVVQSDEKLPYAAEDHEQVMVRALLALSDLVAGGGDVDAYALQVLERQREIIDSFSDEDGNNPKQAYKVVGFGSYLRAILHEERPFDRDLTEREYRRLGELEPRYPLLEEDLERVTRGRFAPPGHGVVQVIALVGRGPYKVEAVERVSTEAFQIAQVALAIFRRRFTIPNLQPVRIPALAVPDSNPTGVLVDVDGRRLGSTVLVTDVVSTARQQFEVLLDHRVARAVIRRAFKVGLTEGAKAALAGDRSTESAVLGIGLDVLGNLWTARERADLRSFCLLPASFQALRIELPEGVHTLTLTASSRGRPTGAPQTVEVRVRSGYNTYVVGLVPTVDGGPPPLTSDPAGRPDS